MERAALLIIALLRLRSPGRVRLPSSLICPFAEFANVELLVSQPVARVIGGAIWFLPVNSPVWVSLHRQRPAELYLGAYQGQGPRHRTRMAHP